MNDISEFEMCLVGELLDKHDLKCPQFRCLDSSASNFRLMRMQPKAQFSYSVKEGPQIIDTGFDSNCIEALSEAKSNHVNLLLLPEYCLSYSTLLKVTMDSRLQPDEGQLWCLPCQGIPYEDFFNFLEEVKRQSHVKVLDDYCRQPYLVDNYFINSLFYIFATRDANNDSCLVVLPQLKTAHMRDVNYLCESSGMTLGKILYLFKGQRCALATVLCADVYNEEITWKRLCDKAETDHFVLLHPQMNTNPREDRFRKLRDDMMEATSDSLCITCNWAAETQLLPVDEGMGQIICISLSWSCIYRKHGGEFRYEDWLSKGRKMRKENIAFGLFPAFIKRSRTAVWFSGSEEFLQQIQLAVPVTTSPAVVATTGEVRVEESRTFSVSDGNWKTALYNFSLWNILSKAFQTESYLLEKAIPHQAEFPFVSSDKEDVDNFFNLVACCHDGVLEMSKTEVPMAWSLILDEDDKLKADHALNCYLKLCRYVPDSLPPHLEEFRTGIRFAYLPPEEACPPGTVESTRDGKRRLIAAYADSEREAHKYLEHLSNKPVQAPWKDEAERHVCIFFEDPASGEICFWPQPTCQISDGRSYIDDSNITEGGSGDA